MTNRLYYEDSHLTEFPAVVAGQGLLEGESGPDRVFP